MIFGIQRPYDIYLSDKADARSAAEAEDKEQETPLPDRTKDIIFQMQMLFARMQFSNVSSVSTSGLTTSFGWDKYVTGVLQAKLTSSDIFVQHDVQELNRVLCDKLEEKMKGQEGKCEALTILFNTYRYNFLNIQRSDGKYDQMQKLQSNFNEGGRLL